MLIIIIIIMSIVAIIIIVVIQRYFCYRCQLLPFVVLFYLNNFRPVVLLALSHLIFIVFSFVVVVVDSVVGVTKFFYVVYQFVVIFEVNIWYG